LRLDSSNLTLPLSPSLPVIYGKLILTAIFWGGTFIAGRQVAQDLGPFSIAFLRFAMASLLLLSLTRIKEGRLPRVTLGQLGLVVLLGLTGVFAYNALFFKGLSLIEASRASLIVATCPAFIALASVLFLRERLAPLQAVGIPLSILGAAVVIAKGDLRQIVAGGVGLGELYSSLAGAIALALPALYEGLTRAIPRASLLDWTSIAYLAVCGTVVGFVWFYEGVRLIGATRAGLFINFVPISAMILAFLMLREPITWSLAVGALLVLSGVYLTNRVAR
jgi:drug/metabolite transporter (DMT)-like permease